MHNRRLIIYKFATFHRPEDCVPFFHTEKATTASLEVVQSRVSSACWDHSPTTIQGCVMSSHPFTRLEGRVLRPRAIMNPVQPEFAPSQGTRVASLLSQRPHFFSKLIDASPLWMRTAFLEQHDPCIYKTCIQSLLLQLVQQYTAKSRWLFIPGSTVHQQPAQSTVEVSTAYLDTYHDHLWWLQRVLQYTHGDHIPDKIKLRVSQMIVSLIMRNMNLTKIQSI